MFRCECHRFRTTKPVKPRMFPVQQQLAPTDVGSPTVLEDAFPHLWGSAQTRRSNNRPFTHLGKMFPAKVQAQLEKASRDAQQRAHAARRASKRFTSHICGDGPWLSKTPESPPLPRKESVYWRLHVMKLIDITGQTFGRLTVVRKAPQPCMWECRCSCGVTRLFTGPNLRARNTRSCGCLHREELATSNQRLKAIAEPWLADMNLYMRKVSYRGLRNPKGKLGSNQFRTLSRTSEDPDDSQHPSLQWALTLEQYTRLVTSPCFYCGQPPHQDPQGVWMKGLGLKRNGIDRADNTKGYLPENCVSCCTACNREKRAQTQATFIENTRRRYEHLKAAGLLEGPRHAAE